MAAMDFLRGSVAELHALEPDWSARDRQIWVMQVDTPALVLGSAQGLAAVDDAAVSESGLAVVRRRSGGGAVLVDTHMLWVDVLIGRGDELWHDDVGRAFEWVGELWARVLTSVSQHRPEVHAGALDPGIWGRSICFVSLGPGEVCVDQRKVVGISQRRTREGARFQCSVLCEPAVESQNQIPELLALSATERKAASAEVRQRVGHVAARRDAVLDALATELESSGWFGS